MKVTLGLAQTIHPEDGNALAVVERYAAAAAEQDVDLLVFPESLMSRYEKEVGEFIREAEAINGPFSQAVCEIAARYGLWIVYTMNEANEGAGGAAHAGEGAGDGAGGSAGEGAGEGAGEACGAKPFNTAIVVDSQGNRRGVYRKVHLFNTNFTQESDRMSAADEFFVPIETPFGKLGLAICYDLRFPEQARAAALQGCDIMLYPAAWVDGPTKADQWRTLLAARAIENEMFVVGVSRADEGYIGQSAVANPYGVLIASGGPDEELIVCEIDTSLREEALMRMPVFSHRREDVYTKADFS